MSFLDRFFGDRTVTTKTAVQQELSSRHFVSPLCSSYENLFAQVRPLIDEMKIIRPYGVGRNGARLPAARTPELALLDSPNDEMGWVEFADLVFATWLTEREVNIHVWHEGKKVTGYTVLPVGCRSRQANGENWYQVPTLNHGTKYLYDDEVMTIRYSRSPRNMDLGVSPATSVEVYAQIDDLMAQYQKAFIENGATPASITFITASTKEKYDTKRKKMEMGYHGAANKNKTLYVWRQMLDDGSAANEVEVKPIQGNNSTLAIKEIIDIVNDHLNKAVGVSNFILGDDSSAKYDNAELSNSQFITRRVNPALAAFWSQFQHELDRITGGLGYGIQYDLEIPELTERKQVIAEIANKNAATLTSLITAGARPSAAVKALGLGEEWESVAFGIANQAEADRALAQSLAQTQNQPQTNNEPTADEKPHTDDSVASQGHSCCCHHTNDADYEGEPVFAENELAEKKIYDALYQLAEKILLEEHPDLTEDEIHAAVAEVLNDKAIQGQNDNASVIAAQVNDTTVGGDIAATLEGDGYLLSESFKKALDERASAIIGGYVDYTSALKLATNAQGATEGWSAGQLKKALSEAMPKNRAEMIARNETVHAFRAGGVENAKNLADKYDLEIEMEWRTADEGACEICKAMNGKRVPVGQAFPSHAVYTNDDGEEVEVEWDHNYYNLDGHEPNAHVNCVLGDTKVKADGIQAMTRYNYSGEVVRITTASGKELSTTANHILLTNRGWVRAKNLVKGDQVIANADSVKDGASDNAVDGRESTVAEEFIALSKANGVIASKMPMTTEDFKGDGVANEEVDIIFADSLLRHKANAQSGELSGYLDLVGASKFGSGFNSFGSLDQTLVGLLAAANGIVGGDCERLALLGSKSGHPDVHSLTSASAYNTRIEQSLANNMPANAEFLSDSFLANAGLVKFDDVIDINVSSVHNTPVYDLMTTSTLYLANDLVSSNCRCTYLPKVVEK